MDDVEPAAAQCVPESQNGVGRRLEMLCVDLRQPLDLHASVSGAAGLGVRRASVHRDLVAPSSEVCRQLLDRALDPAVGRGNTPQADHRDSQRPLHRLGVGRGLGRGVGCAHHATAAWASP